jgi:hypothetical protein
LPGARSTCICHPGKARVTSAFAATKGLFGSTYQLHFAAGQIPNLRIEIGFQPFQTWLLLMGAILLVASPLLLSFVPESLPEIQASAHAMLALGGSIWMWILLFTGAPSVMPVIAPARPLLWGSALIVLPRPLRFV